MPSEIELEELKTDVHKNRFFTTFEKIDSTSTTQAAEEPRSRFY